MTTTMSDAASNADDVSNSVVTMDVLKEFANQIGMQMKASIEPVVTEVNKINAEFTRRMNATDEALNGVINFLNQNKQQASSTPNTEYAARLISEFKPLIMQKLGIDAPAGNGLDQAALNKVNQNYVKLYNMGLNQLVRATDQLVNKQLHVKLTASSIARDISGEHLPNV